ncbi:MAG TPA: nucleoside-diphosphate kinase [Planctomycetota bacterium]
MSLALHERTLIIIKPDGVARGLIGEIISRFEKRGLSVVGMKMTRPERALAEEHYREHLGKDFYPPLLQFITSGPVVVLCLEGLEAIRVARAIVGPTLAREAPSGTIRGDLALSGRNNLIHASDKPDSAEREIRLWFSPGELLPPSGGSGAASREWLYSDKEKGLNS